MKSHGFIDRTLCVVFAFAWLSGLPSGKAAEGDRSAAHRPRPVDSTADGRFYARETDRGRIAFGNTTPNSTVRTFYLCEPRAVALSPDGRFLAAAGRMGESGSLIRVWDTKGGGVVWTLPARISHQSLLKFSPDGAYLASTSQGGVEVWDVCTGERLTGHRPGSLIAHLAFRTDETRALTIFCDDGKTRTIALR